LAQDQKRTEIKNSIVAVQTGEKLNQAQRDGLKNLLINPNTDPQTADKITKLLVADTDEQRQLDFQKQLMALNKPPVPNPNDINSPPVDTNNPNASQPGQPEELNIFPYGGMILGNQGMVNSLVKDNKNTRILNGITRIINAAFIPNNQGFNYDNSENIVPNEPGIILASNSGLSSENNGYNQLEIPEDVIETTNYIRKNRDNQNSEEPPDGSENPEGSENNVENGPKTVTNPQDVIENSMPIFEGRILKLVNDSKQNTKFYVQLQMDLGKGPEWLSEKLGDQSDASAITLGPGEEIVIHNDETKEPLLITNARIWAKNDDQQNNKFKDRNLALVPEGTYRAPVPDIFNYIFR